MRLALSSLALLFLPVAVAGAAGAQLPPPPFPPGNPPSAAKNDLGKALFFEEQLSSTGTVACATCHIAGAGGSDPRTAAGLGSTHPGADGLFGSPDDVLGSPGVPGNLASGSYVPVVPFGIDPRVTSRRAPTMINAAYAPRLFWDGRAESSFADPLTGATILQSGAALESQALQPPVSDVEMAHVNADWASVAARIATVKPLALASELPPQLAGFVAGRTYPELFQLAFGTPDVTPARIAMALAAWERTQISDQSAFDQGNLTMLQFMGSQVFNFAGCAACHPPPFFTDHQFHNIGVRPVGEDPGRFAVTGNPVDQGRFKTPSLRNVALRAPFFHNGGAATLTEVVEFYDRGGDFPFNQDPLIQPLGLFPMQKQALVAFLGALTDPRVASEIGPFARPTLFSESTRVPSSYGAGTAGFGGVVPRAVALEPPLLGNPSFTLALSDARGGVPALLGIDFLPSPAGIPFAGVTVWLGPTPALHLAAVPALDGVGPGGGTTSLTFPLAPQPAFAGIDLFGQWIVVDQAGPQGFSASDAFTFELF